MKKFYIIYWGEGQTQKTHSKTEALKIASELLTNYDTVNIKIKYIY